MISSVVGRGRSRWTELVLAIGVLGAMSADIASSGAQRVPEWLTVGAVAAATAPNLARRRAPLAAAALIIGACIVLAGPLGDAATSVLPVYMTLVPAYGVAAFASRRDARIGLAVCVLGVAIFCLVAPPSAAGTVVGLLLCAAAWAAGRAMRARRDLADELDRKATRLVAEREDRERLAVADERTRIARELHAAVAERVSTMIVQTVAATRVLEQDLGKAEEAMAVVEQTGREVLAEMRRILGVLRWDGGTAELRPQPGLGQIPVLVETARAAGRDVELRVEGEPGPLPASVDLGLYRLVEDALSGTDHAVLVTVVFANDGVELRIRASGDERGLSWPSDAMRDRVRLCGGELGYGIQADGSHRLEVGLPRVLDGSFA